MKGKVKVKVKVSLTVDKAYSTELLEAGEEDCVDSCGAGGAYVLFYIGPVYKRQVYVA